MVEGRDEALTAERQIVSNSLRLSPDEMVVSFESIDSGPVLKLYDVRSGTTRQLARGQDDLGWVLPGGREILWRSLSAMWITDASGEHRRELPGVLSSQSPVMSTRWADQVLFTGAWFLAPDGRSVAVLRGTADSAFLVRASLAGPGTTTIGKYDRNESEVALAAWSSDGTMYLARGNGLGPTTLLGLDQVTGRIRSSITLPAPCAAGGVSVAPLGRRAACVVNERRADVIILDGLKP
jgi:hypothetical protein